MRGAAALSCASAVLPPSGYSSDAQAVTPTADSLATLPKARLGTLQVSRVILGGNLLTHFTHSRDLRYVYTLAARYNTDEKIFETLALAEAHGINTVSMHNPDHPMAVLRRYRQHGGKIQWIICPTAPVEPGLRKYREHVEALLADGCEAIYLWGVHADSLVAQDKIGLIADAVELPRKLGVPSGVGAHDLRVIEACEIHAVPADFYIKTCHHHSYPTGPRPDEITGPYNEFPGYWCSHPKETEDFMKSVKKPWIAFKTMAAGAIPPKQAFRHAFHGGADFVLAGMFDFEIADDVAIANEVLGKSTSRARPWMA
jgi:hypothetical protein